MVLGCEMDERGMRQAEWRREEESEWKWCGYNGHLEMARLSRKFSSHKADFEVAMKDAKTSLKRPERDMHDARPRRATSSERQIIFENAATLPPRQSQKSKFHRAVERN